MLKTMLAAFGKALLLPALFGAIVFSLIRTSASLKAQDVGQRIQISVHQLPTRFQDPIILRCDDAILSGPSEVQDVTCYIKNNSPKSIVAGALSIIYLLDDNGKLTSQPTLLSFDSLLQPDFLAEHPEGIVATGGEYRLKDMTTTFDRPIKNIIAFVDYVEFSDSTKAGVNKGGSQVIDAQRSGARTYREWLAKKYDKTRSIEAITTLLSMDDDMPELGFIDSNEAQGARIFRRQERRIYETKGAEAVLKHIKPQK